MATMKIKELWKEMMSDEAFPFLMDGDWPYPEEDPDYSFLADYIDGFQVYDRYFLKEHGEKTVDIDEDYTDNLNDAWFAELASIYAVYSPSWAHIYNTLNIAYNPVYNVEEHITTKYGEHETETEYGEHETEMEYGEHETETEYGEHETENEYGEHETENEYGATSDTLGTHTDTATNYSVSFDGATEKETGKTSNVVGSQTNTSLVHTDTETSKLHTDTTTSKLHTDTVDRTGNIGIKSATALATEEIFMREKQIFIKNIFLTISRELGAYYGIND